MGTEVQWTGSTTGDVVVAFVFGAAVVLAAIAAGAALGSLARLISDLLWARGWRRR